MSHSPRPHGHHRAPASLALRWLLTPVLLLAGCSSSDDPTGPPVVDDTPPAAVSDLALTHNWGNGVSLSWTPAGDDGAEGAAASVDLRYHTAPIDASTWDAATPVSLEADDADGGAVRVRGLALDTDYWFALRSRDEADNWSPLSNVLAARTDDFRTWYVTPEGDGDAVNISTACIDSATVGDVVLLAAGHYTYANQNSANEYGMIYFPRDSTGFTIRGEEGAENTIIDAQGVTRVIYFHNQATNLDLFVTFEGVTITGGNAEGSTQGYGEGGGVVIHLVNPHFIDCIFRDNVAVDGGGFAQAGRCEPVLENCLFVGNHATNFGGAYFGVNSQPTAILRNCVMIDNVADEAGGGFFSYNTAFALIDCLIVENSAGVVGGGVSATSVHASTITGCTIARNDAPDGSCLRLRDDSVVAVERSILAFGATGGAISIGGEGAVLSMSCNDVHGNEGGDDLPDIVEDLGGNFQMDPGFCGASGVDGYGLGSASPCRPGHHPHGGDCGLVGAIDEVCDQLVWR